MYNRLSTETPKNNSEWFAIRTCKQCKEEITINESDMLYNRNPHKFWKKECYAYCKTRGCTRNKIHISKTFIPEDMLNRIPKNHDPDHNYTGYNVTFIDEASFTMCHSHCKTDVTFTVKDLKIKRKTTVDPVCWKGSIELYIECTGCGGDMKISKKNYKQFIEREIVQYDRDNRDQIIRSTLKNIPLGILWYFGYGLYVVAICAIVSPFVVVGLPVRMIADYHVTKDTLLFSQRYLH